jgi:glycosyltransferase involved in cell wall biosynthesis
MTGSFAKIKGVGADRGHMIHNGVTPPRRRAAPGELRRQLRIPASTRVIGTVARLASQKRIDRLLRAHALLLSDVHCVIAGDGPEKRALQQAAAALGTAERVHFLGHREDKGDVLDAIDVFAITSDQEGLSNAMLEAMSFGVPVVSTPVSGTAESLDDNGAGEIPGIVTSFDEKDIASALRSVLDDPARLKKMGAAASVRAKTEFSIESMLDRWEAVLGA